MSVRFYNKGGANGLIAMIVIVSGLVYIGSLNGYVNIKKQDARLQHLSVLYPESQVLEPGLTVTTGGSQPSKPHIIPRSNQQILELQICKDTDDVCDKEDPWTNDIKVYWKVENGEGCCNTFYCDYRAFTDYCLEPFNLYDISLDGVMFNRTAWDIEDFDYTCSKSTPWNYFTYENIEEGTHTITITQKDCLNTIDEQTIGFELTRTGINQYTLHQAVI